MTLKEYQKETKRTLPDLGASELNIAHMIMGMNSEFNEVYDAIKKEDKVNIGEELTDIMWYLSNYANMKDMELWRMFNFSTIYYGDGNAGGSRLLMQLQYRISILTDLEKKVMAYKKPIRALQFVEAVANILGEMNDCYLFYQLDPEVSMGKNINKLKVRFPEKFSNEAAINRDLEKERETLI